ncbi:MAG: hypothetical protein KGL35_11705 [Bradyrhizobium sp.]|nr:hypothetical protein [Bradyrhizobium sp.]
MPPENPEELESDVHDAPEGDDPDEGADPGNADPDGDEIDGGEDAADDAEADAGDAEDAEPVVAETPKKRTASEVIRDNKRRAKEAERKAEEAERKASEALRRAEEAERRANERRAAESAEDEARRVELMSESEKIAHYRQKDREESRKELSAVQFQVWDSTDRMEFRQLLRDEPWLAQVKDETEAEFERLKAAGRPVAREILANQFLARRYREQARKTGTKERKVAAEGVRRQTVRPPKSRSDVVADRRRKGGEDTPEARRKRLEDVQL